jgi:large subunit ribosomal protein L32
MAVPKRKTSKSRRNKRRSHIALTVPQISLDKTSGMYRLPHHMDLSSGVYRGKKIIEKVTE